MKVLLTGVTGNLGHEIASDLTRRGFVIVPIMRSNKSGAVYSDLTGVDDIQFDGVADCIVHCAGVVLFNRVGNVNEQMMLKVVNLAQRLKIPLYFISTAFVYRSVGMGESFNNDYEQDKWRSEKLLIESEVPYCIFRPSILVGNSKDGKIQNFSGYYLVVKEFLSAIYASKKQGLKLRFPKLSGMANMVTVDQAAKSIGDAIESGRRGYLFVSNPNSPTADWAIRKALEFFRVDKQIEFIECPFKEFDKFDLTEIEKKLYRFGVNFNPYWSLEYNFPNSICTENIITQEYLRKALDYLNKSTFLSHE